jgi:hypothetical protein
MKGKVFTKKQEDQIRRAMDGMDKDLGIDKLDDEKGLRDIFERVEKKQSSSPRGGSGGGGMNPADIEKVPGKRPLKMKKGGLMKDKEMKDMKKMGRGMAKVAMAKKGMKGYAEGKKVSMDALKAHAAKPASKAHKGLKSGGLAAGHKQADGVASKGKTKGMEIKMKNGGMPKTQMMRKSGRGC